MPRAQLTLRDANVLHKISDPEHSLSAPVLIDESLARDPHVTDPADYESVISAERQIIREFQSLEEIIAALGSADETARRQLSNDYDACTAKLSALSAAYPLYASAHNNKAQALRRKFGHSVLLRSVNPHPGLLNARLLEDEDIITEAANHILTSLEAAISLLSPPSPLAPISLQAGKTLAQSYTQRGALYHVTARQMASDPDASLRISRFWTRDDLEEMASRDFMMGGRYGNEIARSLAVATNPAAKLCGAVVKQAMQEEFGGFPLSREK
jgi:hypothetical protein